MKRKMEIWRPTCYSSKWTPAENKAFENALAVSDTNTPDRWERVAAMVPGKSVTDVIRQYRELEGDVSNIEAGLVPIPGYSDSSSNTSSSFTLEWGSGQSYDALKHYSYGTTTGKRSSSSTRSSNQERKKGVPWTEEEHTLFLMGLKKYGKGDWRNISRKFVISRTPTQVASHAQKYFLRQLSSGKEKRRASIHDITTANLNDTQIPSPSPSNNNRNSLSLEDSSLLSQQRRSSSSNANANATSTSTSTSMQQLSFQGDYQQSLGFQGDYQQLSFQGDQQPLGFQGNPQPLGFQGNQQPLGFQDNPQPLGFQENQRGLGFQENQGGLGDGVNSYDVTMPEDENIVQIGDGVQPYLGYQSMAFQMESQYQYLYQYPYT